MDDLADRIAVLNVQKGDVLVFKTSHTLTFDTALRIRETITAVLSKSGAPDVPVLLVDGGARIEVLRPEPGQSPYITRKELPSLLRTVIDPAH